MSGLLRATLNQPFGQVELLFWGEKITLVQGS